MKYQKALGSSVDPEKLALTVKGILTGIIPVLIAVTGAFGVHLNLGDLSSLVDSIGDAIIALGVAISAVMTVWGLLLKIVISLKK